eukprot:1099561-Pyramimonas_sp.AAC.1
MIREVPQKSDKHKALERANRLKQWKDDEGRKERNRQLREEKNALKCAMLKYASRSNKKTRTEMITRLNINGRMEEDQTKWSSA